MPTKLRASTLAAALVILACFVAVIVSHLTAQPLAAQTLDVTNHPISQIQIQGLVEVPEQLVRNQIRLAPGDPYDPQTVRDDIVRITHLGRFNSVKAQVQPLDDGSVLLIYNVSEQPLLAEVQIVGNKALDDQKLLTAALLHAGDPIDPFLIDKAVKEIKRIYAEEGYYLTDVSLDRKLLDESKILIFRVREGPRIRIREFRFEGNEAFTKAQLKSKIQSGTYIPIFRKGDMSRERLDDDAAQLRDFYRERGYLDAQVGRRIDLAPNEKDARVVFLIDEGKRYSVAGIRVEGNNVFSTTQIVETMPLRVGDTFSSDLLQKSQQALIDLYGKLGFIETTVQIDRLFLEKQAKVELLVRIDEHLPHLVGIVTVRGNQVTKDKVIYQQVRGMNPGQRFDRAGIETTRKRLEESGLFTEAQITILGQPQDTYRDILIEVKEANTGRLSFGAGISSDAGLLGAIDVSQRNFDIANFPESWGDLFTGKAFRGAGQYFAISLQPGNETSRYSVSFREPYIFDSQYFFDTSIFYFDREREDWDEQRFGGAVSLGKRFGDIWSASVQGRAEDIKITNVDSTAPKDAHEVKGNSTITSIGLAISRNTTDSRIFPTTGSKMDLTITRAGALGGSYDFTRFEASLNAFWTLDEDFYGRRTVLSLRGELGYLFPEDRAPLFERLYAGGHRTFRGFNFRGVGPRGIRNDTGELGDDPIGGDWLFLVGLEYNFPVYQDVLRLVIFTDTGTVQDTVSLDQYRVSVGAGIRLKVPFLGQAPFALDFAAPLLKEDGDETQVFSFDLALPF